MVGTAELRKFNLISVLKLEMSSVLFELIPVVYIQIQVLAILKI